MSCPFIAFLKQQIHLREKNEKQQQTTPTLQRSSITFILSTKPKQTTNEEKMRHNNNFIKQTLIPFILIFTNYHSFIPKHISNKQTTKYKKRNEKQKQIVTP
jgi:hypothetical protein